MARGKYEAPRKRSYSLGWIVIVLILLGAVSGGVVAYLSASADPLSNQFVPAEHPTITVNEDNTISVSDSGYAVYLRAAVVVNWKNDNQILAQMPVAGQDYTLAVNKGWKEVGGFYYFTSTIQNGEKTTAPVIITPKLTQNGNYNFTVTVIAQTIQAVGQTDGDHPVDAVIDAWGVDP